VGILEVAQEPLLGKRIIYVEDEADCRGPLVDVLEMNGHTVYSYESAEDAQHHLADGELDVAIVDVGLPGRGGDVYAADLRKANKSVRIIFLTGNYHLDHLKKSVPDAYCLTKPVDVDVLLQIVGK
jgi:DNA-binding response OmpR family regulator